MKQACLFFGYSVLELLIASFIALAVMLSVRLALTRQWVEIYGIYTKLIHPSAQAADVKNAP